SGAVPLLGERSDDKTPSKTAASPVRTRAFASQATQGAASPTSGDQPKEKQESQLSRELRAIDTARAALNRGDANGALSAVDQYERTFPNGSLRMEANVVRVEALLARGDKAAARKLARDLLARDPSGPQSRRLQSIADGQ